MKVEKISVGYSRTLNLGNYESARIEASITVEVNIGDDYDEAKKFAQLELRNLLTETYKSAHAGFDKRRLESV